MQPTESSESVLSQLTKWVERQPRKAKGKSAGRVERSETKPIHCDVFHLPLDLLFPGVAASVDELAENTAGSPEADPTTNPLTPKMPGESKSQTGLTCLTCKLVFSYRADQLGHFKTDFHRHNLGRKLKGEPPLDQEQFATAFASNGAAKRLAGDSDEEPNVETSSGESDSSDNDAQDDQQEFDATTAAALSSSSSSLAADLTNRTYRDSHGEVTKSFHAKTGTLYHFAPSSLAGWKLSLSNALFRADTPLADSRRWFEPDADLWTRCLQQLLLLRKRPMIAVLILRSGRFSGAIFDNTSKTDKLIAHKVFRRYTVRAKAGGGQSSHDNKGGKARSMGAQLRRYGEKALEEDVRKQITLWQDYLDNCGLILLATTKRMRPLLFEKPEDAHHHVVMLKKGDPRVVSVPFAVDKPTLEAAQQVHHRVMTALLSPPSIATPTQELASILEEEEEEEEREEGEGAVVEKNKKKKKEEGEEAEKDIAPTLPSCPLAAELIALCETQPDTAAVASIRRMLADLSLPQEEEEEDNEEGDGEENSSSLSTWTVAASYPRSLSDLTTALHIAAQRDLVETLEVLLLHGANPERQDVRGRTPYHLCTSKEARQVFRRCRASLGEDKWDWSITGVPEALTEEKAKQQKQKEKEKKKCAQQRKKEQKVRDEEALEEALGLKQAEEVARELEQQEEEERLRNLAGYCVTCATSLYKRDYYDVLDHRCCSTECVAKLRRKLAAEAALQRFQK